MTKESDDIKPCPFCGIEPIKKEREETIGYFCNKHRISFCECYGNKMISLETKLCDLKETCEKYKKALEDILKEKRIGRTNEIAAYALSETPVNDIEKENKFYEYF